MWKYHPHATRSLRWLLDPDEELGPGALAQVVRHTVDSRGDRRTLAGDILIQAIADARLTSRELAAALTWYWQVGPGRLAEVLTAVAAASPLHRVVVRRSLLATPDKWTALPARPVCALLTLLDELLVADGTRIVNGDARSTLGKLAVGRTRTATLARRVLDHSGQGPDWTPAAAAQALAARVERAHRYA